MATVTTIAEPQETTATLSAGRRVIAEEQLGGWTKALSGPEIGRSR